MSAGDRGATIRVNGGVRPLRCALLVDLLRELGHDARRGGIAVAVNGTMVPRVEWATRTLVAGDAVEIVGAVQGG